MKKALVVISAILLCGIIVFANNYYFSNNEVIQSKSSNEVNNKNDLLTLMYETGDGTGEYQVSTDTTWPSGYIFNATLSACENGSKLSWDDENKKVILEANISDKCYLYFDAYALPTVGSVTSSNITNSAFTLTVSASAGKNPVATYYYSKDNGTTYVSSTNSSYTFSGLSTGTAYKVKVYVVDTAGYKSAEKSVTVTTLDKVYSSDFIKNTYTTQGANGLYLHDSTLANSANDGSYRYAGASVNNYVCFGSDATTCPDDNLYRIIGVFGDQIKLIKSTSLGNMTWDDSGVNTWSSSSLNTYLNGTYLSGLATKWQNMISTHTWQVGGMAYSQTNTAKQYYDVELNSGTTYSAKIGLMYVSDYGFAADPSYWTTELYNYETASTTDWLFWSAYEWTISRISSISSYAFFVRSAGYVSGSDYVTVTFGVRPSFYLESSVGISGGSGTASDPYRLS